MAELSNADRSGSFLQTTLSRVWKSASCLKIGLIAKAVFFQAALETSPTLPIRIVVPFGPCSINKTNLTKRPA